MRTPQLFDRATRNRLSGEGHSEEGSEESRSLARQAFSLFRAEFSVPTYQFRDMGVPSTISIFKESKAELSKRVLWCHRFTLHCQVHVFGCQAHGFKSKWILKLLGKAEKATQGRR
ncbi:unnamed protein product [Musa acuminata subsp. burmannicoides]